MGISARDFQRMQERLTGKTATKKDKVVSAAASAHEIVLGVDPSLRGTGYGVIRVAKPNSIALAHGTISIPASWEHSRCLAKIFETLRGVIAEHKPTACVLEGLFFAQNLQTALIMGEARGASMVAAAQAGLEVFEISPRKMKLAIVGYGAAQKSAVAKMVQRFLQLQETPAADAADALALALAYAQEVNRFSLSPPKRV
ncbi:MAG TPA: crossover junction endodeoxyribonuclease RuvC [Verrucomicrobiae bacterium]|nr:crossover junction endodeoxyribonuclease RuvC [Verrucomicrobiae bacterium]